MGNYLSLFLVQSYTLSYILIIRLRLKNICFFRMIVSLGLKIVKMGIAGIGVLFLLEI